MTRYPGKTVRRRGFTIIEVLVVIAIIGVLVAVTVTAASQVMLRQKVSVTESTVSKVSRMLDAQWQAVYDQAMKDESPLYNYYLNGDPNNANAALRFQGLLAMANGDPNRARVIWAKLRQRLEFPMNFFEATNPIQDTPAAGMRFIYIPPKPTYVQYLSAASAGHQQWAACLYMALQQVHGGRDAHTESSLSTTETVDRTGDGILEIVDAWGNGLAFYRWPALNAELDAMSPAGPPGTFGSSSKKDRDPLDKNALLMERNWWLSPGRVAFEQTCHLVSTPPPTPASYPVGPLTNPVQNIRSYYMIPVVASAGRYVPDAGQPSGVHPTLGIWQPGQVYNPLVPDMMDLAPPPAYAVFDGRRSFDDNIYSYRLRLGGRGD